MNVPGSMTKYLFFPRSRDHYRFSSSRSPYPELFVKFSATIRDEELFGLGGNSVSPEELLYQMVRTGPDHSGDHPEIADGCPRNPGSGFLN